MKKITPVELKEQLEQQRPVFLLDIREQYEWDLSHIPATHIPMAEVCDQVEILPLDQEIVVICKSGRRAEAVANVLIQDYNMSNVSVLKGGLSGWKEEVDSNLIID